MRKPGLVVTGLSALAVLSLAFSGCKDSDSVAGPAVVQSPPEGPSVAGTWRGTFRSENGRCTDPAASLTLSQSGTTVSGSVTVSACGVTGGFRGEMAGNAVSGAIAMQGCTGGAVNGTVSGSSMSLTVGDLLKPLITGDEIVMYGGSLTVHR